MKLIMKTEKEILAEFVALVFKANDDKDYLSKKCLMNGSLSSVRQVANDAIEISSQMRKSDKTKLDAKLLSLGLPPLH